MGGRAGEQQVGVDSDRGRVAAEDEVSPGAADQDISPGAAVQRVVAVPAEQDVGTRAAAKRVVANPAIELAAPGDRRDDFDPIVPLIAASDDSGGRGPEPPAVHAVHFHGHKTCPGPPNDDDVIAGSPANHQNPPERGPRVGLQADRVVPRAH